ncbi:MAG: hypothetical protein KBC96_00870 [Armatimonadetes bacterium]|nr:hypothetical protein [Armatimonadota bacterium]
MSIAAAVSARMKDVWTRGVYDNPVVSRELRTRMRGLKGFMLMGGYVLFLGVVLLIAYYAMWLASAASGWGAQSLVNARLGQKLFMSLNWTQTILLALIIPSLTSGALTIELEKKTIEMLVLTRLTPGVVVLGKLVSAMLYSMILLMCSLPLSGICLMFGGISPAEMAVTYLLLIAWTFVLAACGIFWTSLFNRTASAVLMTYGTIGGYVLSTTILGGTLLERTWYGGSTDVSAMAIMCPGWAPWGVLMRATVCGLKVPIFLPPLIIHFMYGAALLFIAAMHVKYLRAEKALPARLLLIGASLFTTWLTVGDATFMSPMMGFASMAIMVTIVGASMYVMFGHLAPIFASGPMPAEPKGLTIAGFLSVRNMFRSRLSGAFCFVMLWALLEYAVFGLTLAWSMAVTPGMPAAISIPPCGTPHATPPPSVGWAGFYKVGFAVLGVVAAMAAVSILASAILKLRRNAVVAAFVVIILMFAGYGMILATYASIGASSPGNPMWQLAAFWPVTPLIVEANGWQSNTMPLLWWPKSASWSLVGGIYWAITLACLLAAPKMARRFGGVQDEGY